jgi:hypothetical protein
MEAIFKELLAQQTEVETIKGFSISQIDHSSMGGLSNQFIVNGANPAFVKYLVKYLEANQATVIEFVQKEIAIEVDEMRIAVVAEMEAFVATEKAKI